MINRQKLQYGGEDEFKQLMEAVRQTGLMYGLDSQEYALAMNTLKRKKYEAEQANPAGAIPNKTSMQQQEFFDEGLWDDHMGEFNAPYKPYIVRDEPMEEQELQLDETPIQLPQANVNQLPTGNPTAFQYEKDPTKQIGKGLRWANTKAYQQDVRNFLDAHQDSYGPKAEFEFDIKGPNKGVDGNLGVSSKAFLENPGRAKEFYNWLDRDKVEEDDATVTPTGAANTIPAGQLNLPTATVDPMLQTPASIGIPSNIPATALPSGNPSQMAFVNGRWYNVNGSNPASAVIPTVDNTSRGNTVNTIKSRIADRVKDIESNRGKYKSQILEENLDALQERRDLLEGTSQNKLKDRLDRRIEKLSRKVEDVAGYEEQRAKLREARQDKQDVRYTSRDAKKDARLAGRADYKTEQANQYGQIKDLETEIDINDIDQRFHDKTRNMNNKAAAQIKALEDRKRLQEEQQSTDRVLGTQESKIKNFYRDEEGNIITDAQVQLNAEREALGQNANTNLDKELNQRNIQLRQNMRAAQEQRQKKAFGGRVIAQDGINADEDFIQMSNMGIPMYDKNTKTLLTGNPGNLYVGAKPANLVASNPWNEMLPNDNLNTGNPQYTKLASYSPNGKLSNLEVVDVNTLYSNDGPNDNDVDINPDVPHSRNTKQSRTRYGNSSGALDNTARMGLMSMAIAPAVNLGLAARKAETVKPNINRYLIQAYDNAKRRKVAPNYRDADAMHTSIQKSIRDSSGNYGQMTANRIAAYNQMANQHANIDQQAQQANMQLASQADNIGVQLGEHEIAARERARQENLQNRRAKHELFRTGMGQVGNLLSATAKQKAQAKMNEFEWNMLSQMYKKFGPASYKAFVNGEVDYEDLVQFKGNLVQAREAKAAKEKANSK